MSQPKYELCRICGEHSAVESRSISEGLMIIGQACPNCGEWWGPSDLIVPDLAEKSNAHLLPFLAAHIKQLNAAKPDQPAYVGEDWQQQAAEHARTPIPRKLDMLMRWFEKETRYAGQWLLIGNTLAPLIDAQNDKELIFLVDTLIDRGLLAKLAITDPKYRLTAAGWNYLRPIDSGGIPGTAFIAMSFDFSLDSAFLEGIAPAVEACGFTVNRVDRVPHNDQITDRIMAGIRSAQFVVADFTGQRQSVYYEAGFAQGLGKTVVRCCAIAELKQLHFDTRQYLHLPWETVAELRQRLEEHLRATIGDWKANR